MGFDKGDYFPEEGISKAGTIVSDNGIFSGVDLVRKTVNIFKIYNMKCEVIAASLRNARQVREVAEAGAHIATIPFNVLVNMINHPKTAEGVTNFSEDVVEEYRNIFR
jgi:transaldolase